MSVPGSNPLAVLLSRRPLKARYQGPTKATPGRSCAGCKRRQCSPMWACRDGWPCYSPSPGEWVDRGETCENWEDGR